MSESESDDGSPSNEWLLADELFEYCQSDDISEEGIHEIIEYHKESTSDNNHEVSDYGFFHWACYNENVTEGIIRCLLEYFPAAVNDADDTGQLPLHYACGNCNVSMGVIQLLIDAAPDSVRREESNGYMPLHKLCFNTKLDEPTGLEILKLLLEKHPESVRHAENNEGNFPIHVAACHMTKSPKFCSALIEAYPGSERITGRRGVLPFHCACMHNTVDTVEYLYNLYPDAIDHATPDSFYPIHSALNRLTKTEANPGAAADIVKFLLDCDPRVKFQKAGGFAPNITFLSLQNFDDTTIGAGLDITEAIYDADPEAIGDDNIVHNPNFQNRHPRMRLFVYSQLSYFHKAKDEHAMTTPDDNGQLPLHTALKVNATLGSIKLLVKGNPHALQSPDNSGALPLHIACLYHLSARVLCSTWLNLMQQRSKL